jgi:hypothetical protein
MARRPDERESDRLSEENLKELRHNLAHPIITSLPFANSTSRRTVSTAKARLAGLVFSGSFPDDPSGSLAGIFFVCS